MFMVNERPYKPRREPRRKRARTPVKDWNPPEPDDSFELTADARDMVVLGGIERSHTALSAIAFVAGAVLTILIAIAMLPSSASAFSFGGVLARLTFVVLTGWAPFMLFCYAALPWARRRQRLRGTGVASGALAVRDPERHNGPLHVPLKTGFFRSHRLSLMASAASVALGSTGLGFLAVTGLVIEGHKLHGLLGGLSVGLYGMAFALAVVVGLALPVHWWRTYRRLRLEATRPDEPAALEA